MNRFWIPSQIERISAPLYYQWTSTIISIGSKTHSRDRRNATCSRNGRDASSYAYVLIFVAYYVTSGVYGGGITIQHNGLGG